MPTDLQLLGGLRSTKRIRAMNIGGLRKLLDQIMSPDESYKKARKALHELLCNNHQDKIGKLDFDDEIGSYRLFLCILPRSRLALPP